MYMRMCKHELQLDVLKAMTHASAPNPMHLPALTHVWMCIGAVAECLKQLETRSDHTALSNQQLTSRLDLTSKCSRHSCSTLQLPRWSTCHATLT